MVNQNQGNTVERRFEVIKSFSSSDTKARFAHFLNPPTSPDHGARPDFPPNSFFSPNSSDQAKIEVVFSGWKHPQKKWKTWFERMQPIYQPIWEMAGIHQALKNSIYKIRQNKDVILGFAERWCSKTQSFVFPWGESTITLEDVMILGGYPVVGNAIGRCLNAEEASCCNKLEEMREMLAELPAKKASQSAWFLAFMELDEGVEHEAFLSLWLTRFVFPTTSESVVASVFPIAVRLARGERIALAPALLARLYHDLNLVKTCMGQGNDMTMSVDTWAQFQLLQVWVWERFHTLRPQPKFVKNGEPRLARWHKKQKKVEDVRFAIDSAAERFYWRPYVATNNNPVSREFYRDREEWVAVDNVELESFVRCLRVCQLVGIGCIEQYLPHRVAMQFGFDQDVPGHVQANCQDHAIIWRNYIKPIEEDGKVLFFPSRADSAMSYRYFTWWWHPSIRTDLITAPTSGESSSGRRMADE